ncbi:MAG TPA: YraN family protein [Clostridiales bacterium]|nr:YraN family protein [Clostridiales bacterium]
MDNWEKGRTGERIAAAYLQDKGYEILEYNFRAGRQAEIDMIARQGEYLCFIEVKCRFGTTSGKGREAISPLKRNKIRLAAREYLYSRGYTPGCLRFDVIEVQVHKSQAFAEVRHFENAF